MEGGEHEDNLFRRAMQDVKPLKRRALHVEAEKGSPGARETKNSSDEKRMVPIQSSTLPASNLKLAYTYLEHGDIVGVDRRTGQRFKRGQLPIEACLDLHGMTQEEADRSLSKFLTGQQLAGRRCVIVVTGKGVGKKGAGVLRSAVPRWLNQMPNRDKVLAFDYARQKDGGVGALYILLRRRRGSTG